jgi:transcriptional regulator with XRE-family HTH domain
MVSAIMKDHLRKELGKRIRELREALGLSQIELARKVHKSSAAYIAFIESGERNISTMDLICLAKELGTTVADLVGEDGPEKKVQFKQALRNSGDLDAEDKRRIMDYYEFLKSKRNAER